MALSISISRAVKILTCITLKDRPLGYKHFLRTSKMCKKFQLPINSNNVKLISLFLKVSQMFYLSNRIVSGKGSNSGGGGNFGTGVRASILKPTLIIYLAFEKNSLFIYFISQKVDLFIH